MIRRGNDVLVFEGRDSAKQQIHYRPLGGGIEFGELGREAVARELREEIGAEILDPRYLGTIENRYTLEGQPAHEIVLVYAADLADSSLYAAAEMVGHEESGTPFRVLWMPLSHFTTGAAPLYPVGLLQLLGQGDG